MGVVAGCSSTRETPVSQSTGSTPIHPKFAKKAFNRPYEIKGTLHKPKQHYEHVEVGIASYYGGGDVFHGRKTSTGQVFDMHEISAAHKYLPLPCIVRVTNLENGRTLKVPVVDRGPFVDDRVIDLSRKAAQLLGFHQKGLAKVRVETLVHESLHYAENYKAAEGHTVFAQNHATDVKKIDLAAIFNANPTSATVLPQSLPQGPREKPLHVAARHEPKETSSGQGEARPGEAAQPTHLAASSVPTETYERHVSPALRRVSPELRHGRESSPSPRTAEDGHPVANIPPAQRAYQAAPPVRPLVARQASNPVAPMANPMQQLLAEAKPVVLNAGYSGQLPPIPPQYLVQRLQGTFVQAGTYAQLDQARHVVLALQQVAPQVPVRLLPLEARGRHLFRVYVGPVQSSQQASNLLSMIARKGYQHASVVQH